MRHHLLCSTISMASSSSSSSALSKPISASPRKPSSNPNNPHQSSPNCTSSYSLSCKHSPAATLDILIFILVLFSGIFLISSYFSYVFQSLSLLLPSFSFSTVVTSALSSLSDPTLLFYTSFLLFFVAIIIASEIRCSHRSSKCGKPGCKALKKATKFDLKLQGDECLRSRVKEVREIDELPWKGGSEVNPDYECLRAELRKMAPPNGRAVLLFREKCGCPVAKLEGWSSKRGRRHKRNGDR